MKHPSINSTFFYAKLSLALFLTTLGHGFAEEPFSAALNKWAPDTSIAETDESFSLEAPASERDPLVIRFTFLPRAASAAPQIRSIFDTSSFATFVPEEGKPVVLRLEIKGNQAGRHVRLRMVDANSEVFDTKPLAVEEDYGTLEFPLETFIEAHWGGDDNGRLDWPLKMMRIETVDWAGHSASEPETLSVRSLKVGSTP